MIRALATISMAAMLITGSTWAGEQSSLAVASQIAPDQTLEYGEQISCVELRRIRATKVLDPQHMLFYMRSATIYLNQFENPCELLTDKRITSFNTVLNGRLCRRDRLEVLHDLLIPEYRGGGRTGFQILSWCHVGPFERVTSQQVEFLRTRVADSSRTVMDALRSYRPETQPQ